MNTTIELEELQNLIDSKLNTEFYVGKNTTYDRVRRLNDHMKYRLLQKDEVIKPGDEYFSRNENWVGAHMAYLITSKVGSLGHERLTVRRWRGWD